MVNFIICEDNKYVREMHENIISKIAMPQDFNYTVYSFDKYNIKLKNLIRTQSDIKIYILDLELPNKSGIDIAREIRKIDWNSIIIILTSHDELELKLLKEKLLIFDFISKFDNYENRLIDSIKMVLKKVNKENVLGFKCGRELYHVKFENILYVCKDNQNNKIKLVTHDKEYYINGSLHNLTDKLDNRFYQTHRSCYINLDEISSVDFKNNVIHFNNGISIDYLSRNYKKDLRNKL